MRSIAFLLLFTLTVFGQPTNVSVGTTANDGTGDTIRLSMQKLNYFDNWLKTNITTASNVISANLTTVSNLAAAGGGADKISTNAGTGFNTVLEATTKLKGGLLYSGRAVTVHGTSTDVIAQWPTNFAANTGYAVTSLADAGSQVSDGQIDEIFQAVVETNSIALWPLFYNDMRANGLDATDWSMSSNSALAGAVYLAIPDSQKIFRANTATTGSWANAPTLYYGGGGSYSSTDGGTRTWTNYGTTAYVAILATVVAGDASAIISIDGTPVSTNSTGGQYATNGNNRGWAPIFLRYPNLSDGPHVITLTIDTSGSDLVFLWAAGNRGNRASGSGFNTQLGPDVFLGDTLRMSSTGYALGGATFGNGSDAAVAHANSIVQSIVNDLSDDGLRVSRAYPSYFYDPLTMVGADHVHPAASGNRAITASFETAVNVSSRQTQAPQRNRHFLEAGQGAARSGTFRAPASGSLNFRKDNGVDDTATYFRDYAQFGSAPASAGSLRLSDAGAIGYGTGGRTAWTDWIRADQLQP